jgi:hypothetical protein
MCIAWYCKDLQCTEWTVLSSSFASFLLLCLCFLLSFISPHLPIVCLRRWVTFVELRKWSLQPYGIHLECRRWGEVAFTDFPLLLHLNGNDRGHSKVGSCSTISTCQLYKVANRKGGVGDTAAKAPTPTAIMRYSKVQRQCLSMAVEMKTYNVSYFTIIRKRPSCHNFFVSLDKAQKLSHTFWLWSVW